MEADGKGSIKVIAKAMAALSLFDEKTPEWGASEVATQIGTSVATAHRILHSLADSGYLAHRQKGRFGLGPAAFVMGERAQAAVDVQAALLPYLRELADRSGETAILVLPPDDSGTVVLAEVVPANRSLKVAPPQGDTRPVTQSAFGHAILAYIGADQRDRIQRRLGDRRPSDDWPTLIHEVLPDIRSTGYATTRDGLEDGSWEIAAPVRSRDGRPIAAIGIAGPRMPETRMASSSAGPMVLSVAGEAEATLGAWNGGVQILPRKYPGGSSSSTSRRGDKARTVTPIPWGTLRIGHTVSIEALNPLHAINVSTMKVISALYPVLLNIDESDELIGDLAESWTVQGNEVTAVISTGGVWTDGKPITAHDVAFTLNLLATGEHTAYRSLILGIVSASGVDEATVTITCSVPGGNVLRALSQIPILPRHVWTSRTANARSGAETLVTGGPFRLASVDDDVVVLEIHKGCYCPRPQVERIVWIHYRSDESMVDHLRQGAIDAIDHPAGVPAGFEALERDRDVVSWRRPGDAMWYVGFNSNPEKQRHPELLDPEIRRAIAHGTDRVRVVRDVLRGMGEPADSVLTPSLAWWRSQDPPIPFDLEEANRILDERGLVRGEDGVRLLDGARMSYRLAVSTDVPAFYRVVEFIRADWRMIGIDIVPEFFDMPAMDEVVTGPDGTYQGCDIFLWAWMLPTVDPGSVLRVLTSRELGSLNDTGFQDEMFEHLFELQSSESDVNKRKRHVQELDRIVRERIPYLPICYVDQVGAYRAEWSGLSQAAGGPFRADTKQPYIKATRVR